MCHTVFKTTLKGRNRLQQISGLGDLWVGYQLRADDKGKFKNVHPIIQLSDLADDAIDTSGLATENLERVRDKDFVRTGDILLRSRGASYRAFVVPPCPPQTVAIAPLFVLRLTARDVLPSYLAWYINRPTVQAELATRASGTYTPSVSLQAFGELEVIVPPPAEQERIVEADVLLREENALTRRVMEQRERLVQARLEAFLKQFKN